jgi:peptidoglycan-associated lipoprotein
MKETVKTDMSAPSTALTTSMAAQTPSENIEIDGSKTTDSAHVESFPKTGDAAEQFDAVKTGNRLDTVYFDFDSCLLNVEARNTLTRNARWLDENRRTRVIIEGHADERGSDEYNLALAEKRALAAQRYIETLGANPGRMETISYGENQPAVTGHDEATWAKNRRVEFIIVK